MTSAEYNWKRFWIPWTAEMSLEGGYLNDPDAEYGRLYNPDVVSFGEIEQKRCLILLGEPGIGKSHALQGERQAVDARASESGGKAHWLDLHSVGSEVTLMRGLFDHHTVESWKEGTCALHLFLDSFDECLIRLDTLVPLLADELGKWPLERLYLRIACRTAAWPSSFDERLRKVMAESDIGHYELTPLRKTDVEKAARANNLNAEKFLKEVEEKEISALAAKPITLRFLLNSFKKNVGFPSTQSELYHRGCKYLCDEVNPGRREASVTRPTLSAEQRMAVAARIAGVTVFCSRAAVYRQVDLGDAPREDVTVEDLAGGKETALGCSFPVTEAAIREALSTGLFSSRGPNRMGWAHQTFAEFLAANYVVEHKAQLPQIMDILTKAGDEDGKVIPQLHQTAAWLAGMSPEVFREMVKSDPDVLLRSDIATADPNDRLALVDSLLRLCDEEKLIDANPELHLRYRKLAHPGLARQLRPYIVDRKKSKVARRVATDIAEACKTQSLQKDLLRIALNKSESLTARENAAQAISSIGDSTTRAKLKPLAVGNLKDDLNDELKGCALRAVWPDHMTAKELFAALSRTKRGDYVGAYVVFVYSLRDSLRAEHLVPALEWVAQQPHRESFSYHFDELIGAVMLKGWQSLDQPGIVERFVKAVVSRLKCHDRIIGNSKSSRLAELAREDKWKRRIFLQHMIPLLSSQSHSETLLYGLHEMSFGEDIPFMLDRLKGSKSQTEKRLWALAVSRAHRWNSVHTDLILAAVGTSAVLFEEFRSLISPVELNSEEAKRMRRLYLEWNEGNDERQKPLLVPPPSERVNNLLAGCEAGQIEAWIRLTRDLQLKPESTHYDKDSEPDLTLLPGWESADDSTRLRILAAGKRFVLEQDPHNESWLGTKSISWAALAGFKALVLILKEERSFLTGLPENVWNKWCASIFGFPYTSEKGEEAQNQLARLTYGACPDEVTRIVLILIEGEDRNHGSVYIHGLETCLDDRFAEAILATLRECKLEPLSFTHLLGLLLKSCNKRADQYARSFLRPIPRTRDRRQKAVTAARLLLNHAPDAGWSVIWPAIQRSREFGRELFLLSASVDLGFGKGLGKRLQEDQLADLFTWLAREFPYSDTSKKNGAHMVSQAEQAAQFRDAVLEYLKTYGTFEACKAIQRIMEQLPELDWLKWTLLRAKEIARSKNWQPLSPSHLVRLVSNPEHRLVVGADQLVDVVLESLKRMEDELHGETPTIEFLWDKIGQNRFKPKDENSFSNYVKSHFVRDLKQRGVVINREVEIRRGEKTDIRVDAIVKDKSANHDVVSVIIEVKGCWHPKLKAAMKDQLVDRYLWRNACQHGIYLIGWFNCKDWDRRDSRKPPKLELSQARTRLATQARELSQEGLHLRALVIDTALSVRKASTVPKLDSIGLGKNRRRPSPRPIQHLKSVKKQHA